jgi:adenylate cyclase
MAKEIERKFLLARGASIPIPDNYEKLNIKQGYIFTEKGRHLRIRLYKDKAVICLKFTDGPVRDEFEYEVPMKDGKDMYKKCTMKLEKHRLTFKRFNENYDVDSYPNGMQFVEVEFKTLKASKSWVKPHWIGKEITGSRQYSNIILAKKNLKW